jgi:hypothetical protein
MKPMQALAFLYLWSGCPELPLLLSSDHLAAIGAKSNYKEMIVIIKQAQVHTKSS